MSVWPAGLPCATCGAPLAADQRYCLACGERRSGAEPAARLAPVAPAVAAVARSRPALTLPTPRSAAALSVVVLGMGVLIGAAVGPAAVGSQLAAQRAVVVLASRATGAGGNGDLAAPIALGVPDGGGGASGALDAGASGGVDAAASSGAQSDTGSASGAGSSDESGAGTGSGAGGGTSGAGATTRAKDPPSTRLAGTVVHLNDQAGGFAIADAHGRLIAVHDATPPKLGDAVEAQARKLANGTYAASELKRGTPAGTATFGGVVTAVDAQRGAYVVSARGVSLVVDVPGAAPPPPTPPTGTTPATTPTTPTPTPATTPTPPPSPLPVVGLRVKVTVAFVAPPAGSSTGTPARLEQRTRADLKPATQPLDYEAIIRAVGPAAHTITLTSDDLGALSATLTAHLPGSFRLGQLAPDSTLAVTARPRADGTLDVTGLSADGGAIAADDPAFARGDQRAKR